MYEWFYFKVKKRFPRKEKFYSSLTSEKISDKKFELFLKIWNTFEMETMKDYHDLYLKAAVVLLADVFGNLRNGSLESYG